jgi:hypothetical protein
MWWCVLVKLPGFQGDVPYSWNALAANQSGRQSRGSWGFVGARVKREQTLSMFGERVVKWRTSAAIGCSDVQQQVGSRWKRCQGQIVFVVSW